jgi:hypothetical protein
MGFRQSEPPAGGSELTSRAVSCIGQGAPALPAVEQTCIVVAAGLPREDRTGLAFGPREQSRHPPWRGVGVRTGRALRVSVGVGRTLLYASLQWPTTYNMRWRLVPVFLPCSETRERERSWNARQNSKLRNCTIALGASTATTGHPYTTPRCPAVVTEAPPSFILGVAHATTFRHEA